MDALSGTSYFLGSSVACSPPLFLGLSTTGLVESVLSLWALSSVSTFAAVSRVTTLSVSFQFLYAFHSTCFSDTSALLNWAPVVPEESPPGFPSTVCGMRPTTWEVKGNGVTIKESGLGLHSCSAAARGEQRWARLMGSIELNRGAQSPHAWQDLAQLLQWEGAGYNWKCSEWLTKMFQ